MRIRNHRFVDHWFELSKDVGSALDDPRFIVMHYTAGGAGSASRDYMLKSPTEKQKLLRANAKVYASAHLVVDRDGSAWQIIPFNRKGRHAGISRWRGLDSLNQCSIGIEIANYGWLDQRGDGSFGRSDTPRFAASEVTLGTMPGGSEAKGWEPYAAEQLDTVEQLTRALLGQYPSITEVVGHQDISPGRKFDPGPAFPMQRFRNLVDGRGSGALDNERNVHERGPERYVTGVSLNIRGGPGTGFDTLDASPLPLGTEVTKLYEEDSWYFVQLVSDDSIRGWVHGRYVRLL